MKRAIASVLIVSVLGGQLGILGALVGRHQARQEAQHQIETSDASQENEALRHLTIPQSARQSAASPFRWVEDGEFWYEGNLYDVVRDEWRGAVWHVWAYHDREEERYLNVLDRTVGSLAFQDKTVPRNAPVFLYSLLALLPAIRDVPSPPPWQGRSYPQLALGDHAAPYLEVSHPPPWG